MLNPEDSHHLESKPHPAFSSRNNLSLHVECLQVLGDELENKKTTTRQNHTESRVPLTCTILMFFILNIMRYKINIMI